MVLPPPKHNKNLDCFIHYVTLAVGADPRLKSFSPSYFEAAIRLVPIKSRMKFYRGMIYYFQCMGLSEGESKFKTIQITHRAISSLSWFNRIFWHMLVDLPSLSRD